MSGRPDRQAAELERIEKRLRQNLRQTARLRGEIHRLDTHGLSMTGNLIRMHLDDLVAIANDLTAESERIAQVLDSDVEDTVPLGIPRPKP